MDFYIFVIRSRQKRQTKNTWKNGMVSLKKSMTLGGTRNVAMTAFRQVLANADDPTRYKIDPAGQPATKILRRGGNYWGD